MITRQIVADNIDKYLKQRITKEQIINWAENAIMNDEFEKEYFDQINNALKKIGVADVKNFDLVWDDYVSILRELGYKITIDISKVS